VDDRRSVVVVMARRHPIPHAGQVSGEHNCHMRAKSIRTRKSVPNRARVYSEVISRP
jgi:hypothetical protein